jgi:hypothetical protein
MKNERPNRLETTSDKPRIEQGSNRDRTRIEQGQIPSLIPVLSELDSALITPYSEPAPTRFPGRQNQSSKRS